MNHESMSSSPIKLSVLSIALGAVFGFAVGFLLHWFTGMWNMIGMSGLFMALGGMIGAFVGRMMERTE